MKVKNIAFSGVMATILLSAGAASAETAAKIASQKYVDNKVGGAVSEALTTVSNTYATTETVEAVSNQVTNISNALNDEETGLRAQITAVKSTADQNQEDITDLNTRVNKNTKDITDLKDGLDKTVADSIAGALTGEGAIKDAIDEAIETAVGDLPIGTLTTDVNKLKTTVGDENSGLVQDVNALKETVGDATDGLVKQVNDNESAINTLNGDEDTTGSVANTVKELAIPKPSVDCAAASGRCVLSVSDTGDLMWLDVTAPLDENSQSN